MRSSRFVPTLATVAALVALLTPSAAGASADGRQAVKHPSPNGHCAVNINAAPGQITAGDAVVVFGRLRCNPKAVVGDGDQTVTLLEHASGTPGFGAVQNIKTETNGFYEFTVTGVENSSVFQVRAHRAASGDRTVKVAAQVTLNGPSEDTQLLTGTANKVTFTGSVSPADTGARVILQRQNAVTGNEWRRIDSGVVAAGGSFSIRHTFRVPGDANIRVLVRSARRNVPSASNVLNYDVSQAQNPALTILASADPISSSGGSVTISGFLAGGAKEPVTLEARTARQNVFAAVAEVTTEASGAYTFPAQSPIQSTFYEVRGAHRQSAVLFEGVKDVLTAGVSQTKIQAGGSLTFSGTVTPDHAGHVIYLERQNASGMGFHVVEIATVGAGSAYSIAHTVYDAGTKVFEVRIPGGPENEGATSAPFTIDVTPAPAAVLLPEAPGNTSGPSEGQT